MARFGMSLRARLIVGMVVVAVVLVGAMVVITRTTESNLVDRVDAQLEGAGGPVRRLGRPGDPDGPGGPGGPEGAGAPGTLSSLYVGSVGADGVVTTLATPNVTGDELDPPRLSDDQVAAATGKRVGPVTVGTDPDSSLRYRVLLQPDDRSGGALALALPLKDVDASVARLVRVEILVSGLILALLALVAFWVIRLGVRPIKQMTKTASAIAAGDLSHRVPEVAPGTEAGELGTALNRMLGSIETAFEQRAESEDRLRQFVADASHEPRTPITTIRGYAELYRSGGLADRPDLDQAMRRTEQESIRMGTLVEDLLLLARLDQGRPLEHRPVDLGVLAVDAAGDARAVDPDRAVTASVEEAVVVAGDEGRLRQVVANLVGNALVHTPDGTPVHIDARRDDGLAVIEVSDQGPGMAGDTAARAFERFYRADPARSRHRGGSGLGLSIVKATVEAHGGQVALRSAPSQGTTVRIELPPSAV